MRKSYVYKITCKINDEFYFGSSFNAKSDWYWGKGRKIKERISQYGKENFIKEILGEFDDRVEAHKVENDYIEKFRHDDKCLNQILNRHFGSFSEETCAKNSAANIGRHFSKEHRARMSVAQRGKHLSEETKAKLSAANSGKHLSEETKAKISAVHRGKHRTDEIRAKISAAQRGKTFSKEHRAKISAANRGKHHTEEVKAKIGAALRGKHFSEEHRAKIGAANHGKLCGKHWRKNPVTGKREWYD